MGGLGTSGVMETLGPLSCCSTDQADRGSLLRLDHSSLDVYVYQVQ